LGLGAVFTIMGVSLFFNKSLMRLGNLMFIAGVPTTIGPSRTAGYFLRPEKMRAPACLCLGIFLVFVGWPIFGMALEVFGILNLFGNMFPMFWVVFKNLPIVSSITKSSGSGRRPTYSYNRERERDYRDDPYADDRQDYGDYRDEDAESYY
jgi:Na+/proline symporter